MTNPKPLKYAIRIARAQSERESGTSVYITEYIRATAIFSCFLRLSLWKAYSRSLFFLLFLSFRCLSRSPPVCARSSVLEASPGCGESCSFPENVYRAHATSIGDLRRTAAFSSFCDSFFSIVRVESQCAISCHNCQTVV